MHTTGKDRLRAARRGEFDVACIGDRVAGGSILDVLHTVTPAAVPSLGHSSHQAQRIIYMHS